MSNGTDVMKQFFPTKYLSGADLDEGGRGSYPVTISRFSAEEMQGEHGEKERKLVLWFNGAQKGLVANKGNAEILTEAFGGMAEQWIGKRIELYVVDVSAFGKMTRGVRVRIPGGDPAPAPLGPPIDTPAETALGPQEGGSPEGDIPF